MRDVGDGDADDVAAGVLRVGIGYRMHRVVVIFGVRRIDGDEGHATPVFAAGKRSRPCGLGFVEHGARKRVRNFVGVDGDQTDGALALERAEPRHDGAGGKPEPAVPCYFDRDEIAVDRARGGVRGNAQFTAELLFVDRCQPAAAAGKAAKNSKRAALGAVDQLDDASAGLLLTCLLDADQGAVADARNLTRLGAPRHHDVDNGRRAMGFFVPLCWSRQ